MKRGLRKYIPPFLLAIGIGLPGCGAGEVNNDFEDEAAPGMIEEGEGVDE